MAGLHISGRIFANFAADMILTMITDEYYFIIALFTDYYREHRN